MFNEYGMYQMMKLRQEETERNANNAWKHYENSIQNNETKQLILPSKTASHPCCQCACV